MKIGYARVSTGLQNLDLQEDSLEKFGCEKVFTDHMIATNINLSVLETAIEFVRRYPWFFYSRKSGAPYTYSTIDRNSHMLLFLLTPSQKSLK